MKYKVIYRKNFERDYARCKRRGYDMDLLKNVVTLLAETGTLPAQHKPISFQGNTKGVGNVTSKRTGC